MSPFVDAATMGPAQQTVKAMLKPAIAALREEDCLNMRSIDPLGEPLQLTAVIASSLSMTRLFPVWDLVVLTGPRKH